MRLIRSISLAAFIAALGTLPQVLFAAPADSLGFRNWQGPSWGGYVKMLLALAVVLVLVWVVLSLLRRTMGLRGAGIAGVQLLGGISLGQRRSLQFIKVGKALLLIGATDHHLGLIARIDDPQEMEAILARPAGAPQSFGNLLQKLGGRNVKAPGSTTLAGS